MQTEFVVRSGYGIGEVFDQNQLAPIVGNDLMDYCLRNGAGENDLVGGSAAIWGGALGLQNLGKRKMKFQSEPKYTADLAEYDYIVGRTMKPEAGKTRV
ncbi:hypothetical protein FQA39_LY18862 [Lamprigera yunnana]|nr:hypothetical protein FQA39_LY18862 [Lamprigera yunnana]